MNVADQIRDIAKEQGIIRPRDLAARGIAREHLRRLCRAGKLHRVARGVYMLPDRSISEHHSLALAAKRIPKGVICLLSALRFHGLTTQSPHQVWIALPNNAVQPSVSTPAIRLVRFSGPALEAGVERHSVEGVAVKVYGAAKTVADCFKYRNKIGVDVAIEALRDALSSRKATIDEIYRFAKVCRVANVMRPYLESAV